MSGECKLLKRSKIPSSSNYLDKSKLPLVSNNQKFNKNIRQSDVTNDT